MNEASSLVLQFGQSTKVACAFQRMKTGKKPVPASHAGKRVPPGSPPRKGKNDTALQRRKAVGAAIRDGAPAENFATTA
jgi:hypothetical protein